VLTGVVVRMHPPEPANISASAREPSRGRSNEQHARQYERHTSIHCCRVRPQLMTTPQSTLSD